MNQSNLPRVLFFFLSGLLFVTILIYHQYLPATVASHFNFKGEADSFMNKNTYTIVSLAFAVFMTLLFPLIIFIIKKAPAKSINLPNKEYWLAEERKDETLKTLGNYLYLLGSLVLMLFVFIFYHVYRINLFGEVKIAHNFWIYLVIFLPTTFYLVAKMILHFYKKKI